MSEPSRTRHRLRATAGGTWYLVSGGWEARQGRRIWGIGCAGDRVRLDGCTRFGTGRRRSRRLRRSSTTRTNSGIANVAVVRPSVPSSLVSIDRLQCRHRRGPLEPRDRRAALPVPSDRRGAPLPDLPEARRDVTQPAPHGPGGSTARSPRNNGRCSGSSACGVVDTWRMTARGSQRVRTRRVVVRPIGSRLTGARLRSRSKDVRWRPATGRPSSPWTSNQAARGRTQGGLIADGNHDGVAGTHAGWPRSSGL
jgi:hypothetical protein